MGCCGLSCCEWLGGVYFFLKNKYLPIESLVSALLRLTCPIAIVGMHYPVSIYSSLVANVATYALVGLVVETMAAIKAVELI
jgi:hypothetical protein